MRNLIWSFIKKNCKDQGIEREFTIVEYSGALARILLPNLNRFKLDTVAKALNVSLENHHRAVDDAACTAEIFVKFIEMLKERGMENLDDVNHMVSTSPETVMKMPTYHAIIRRQMTSDVSICIVWFHFHTSRIIIRDHVCQKVNLSNTERDFF